MDDRPAFGASTEERHQRRLNNLIDRLPARFRDWTRWLLKPESRWARLPAGVLLICGGFLGMLPVLGFWMLPLGLILLAEDLPIVRRGSSVSLIGSKTVVRTGFRSPTAID